MFSFFMAIPAIHSDAKPIRYSFTEIVAKSELIMVGVAKDIDNGIFFKDIASFYVLMTVKDNESTSERKTVKIKYGNIAIQAKEDRSEFLKGKKYLLFLTKLDDDYYEQTGIAQGYYVINNQDEILVNDYKIENHEYKIGYKKVKLSLFIDCLDNNAITSEHCRGVLPE